MLGYLSLVQLGITGFYDVPDPTSAGMNALGAAAGLAVGGWLIGRASPAALAVALGYAGTVVVAGCFQLTQGLINEALAIAVVSAGLGGLLTFLALAGFGRSTRERAIPSIDHAHPELHIEPAAAPTSAPPAEGELLGPSAGRAAGVAVPRMLGLSGSQVAAIVAGLACLVVFVLTLLPGVSFGDSAELQRVPFQLGIPHPTGFPVYVLLGKLFSLIPIGSIAWRANFLSAVAASSAAAVAALSMGRLGVRPTIAAAAASAAALTTIVWTEATTAEVSAVHLLFVSLLIHRALLWRDERRPRDLYLGALLLGLAAVNHPTAIALAPIFVVYVVWVGRAAIWARPGVVVRAALAFLFGVTPLLYTAARAVAGGNDLYRYIATLDGFTYWVTGSQMSVSMHSVLSVGGLGGFVLGLPAWLAVTADRSTPLFVGLAGIGAVATWRRDRAFALFGAGVVALSVYLYVNYVPTLERYLLVVMLVMAIWMGVGLEWLFRWLDVRRIRLSAVSILIPVLLVGSFWPAMNQSDNHLGEQFVADVFSRMPTGSVVLSYWDAVQPMGYQHCVEGWRPDIAVLAPFDRDYDGCDPQGDLATLVSNRPVYALLLFPSDLQALGSEFQLTQVATVMAPFGGRTADVSCGLYRVDPKPVASEGSRPSG
jgi:hypothetical protein